ncbi:MAG: homoserine kinase [Saprospiraceae bacterium]|nr:homoserine kinase [Saprospiraceae bacterium]
MRLSLQTAAKSFNILGIKAFAPAAVGNIGIGFDIMGLAIERPGDEVIARKSDIPGVRITKITGAAGKLPYEPEQNTAGVAALRLLAHLGESARGIELEIHKKMPIGSGMGSSAASAAAAVLAVSELLRTGMSKRELLPFAAAGEQIASGSPQADNIAPSLLGGMVLVRDHVTLDVHRLHVPRGLYVALVHPKMELFTRDARAVLRPDVPMEKFVRQSANVAAFVIGLFNADLALVGRSLNDEIVEPQRAHLIPGFYAVKTAALEAGALGCSISGAGPSVFALCANSLIAENAGAAMQRAFAEHHLDSEIFLSPINQEGAVIC